MPVFRLNFGSPEGAARFGAYDEFTQGYITAAFWLGDEESDIPSLAFENLHASTLDKMSADCAKFQADNKAALAAAYERGQPGRRRGDRERYDSHCAGVDFFLTRNGHGTGFWDRALGDVGETLSTAARLWRETDLYQGDDKNLYLM